MLQISSKRLYLKYFADIRLHWKICTARNISLQAKEKPAIVECLNNRGILRVSGAETSAFLQGLITNDMRHLEEGSQSMYAMFLNTKGRVMYDSIIYRTNEEGAFLVECDKSAVAQLQKHLKMFRVRRKIDVENVDNIKVWVIFNPELAESENFDKDMANKTENEAIIKNLKGVNDIIACRDPRLSLLGIRIIAPSAEDITIESSSDQVNKTNYRAFRYKLGIGEGMNDLPPGNCFPLEANGDYLHGVSFHKGCYIGQELTARTHHTGVVRKRLMPLVFESAPQNELKSDTSIQHPSGCNKSALGKLRGVEQNVGLALLRISEALDVSKLKISDIMAETMKPFWWPQEAPKDRASMGKI